MAKKDIIAEIVEENPSLDPKQLDDNYTVPQLEALQQQLRNEKVIPNTVKYRLKDSNTQYAECYAEGSFTLAGDQEKELPAAPSKTLLDRIEYGFIVEVK
ncbi:hypothetical protein ABR776_27300 [Bacillus cereus]|uniref:Uncharacterized protein n=1 Tax=Bacillus cereus TaxID=1396 RepID=A0A1C4FPK7_BACCE|nr:MULTISPECIES: hypothetical protein [Bacillus cereus group]HDR7784894.1 hypothetical protein [Bacillus wiedmannii]MCU5435784.1 hypothetical protein [Bacillus mobilis]OKA27387.1 hypothetical protein BJR06_30210 [Bacillus cereus]OKA30463.1 hypothetical protein BJR07_29785 [Bacillus cereus]SCC57583.1 Uncharacterized protein BC0861_06165 [Bacillus mobilis]